MTPSTKGPWRQGIPPNENVNQIFGVGKVDGSRKLVAEVYGFTPDEVEANVKSILAWCNWMYEA